MSGALLDRGRSFPPVGAHCHVNPDPEMPWGPGCRERSVAGPGSRVTLPHTQRPPPEKWPRGPRALSVKTPKAPSSWEPPEGPLGLQVGVGNAGRGVPLQKQRRGDFAPGTALYKVKGSYVRNSLAPPCPKPNQTDGGHGNH